MRSAYRISLFLLLLGAAVARAQINPATQIRWPNNCVGGNLFYDIVNNTCTSGSVTVTIGVNGTPVTTPNFSDTSPAAPSPNQNVHFQNSGNNISAYVAPSSSGGAAGTCVADQQAGATWDAKVQACLNVVYANGGSTVDARGLTGSQTMARAITVGNGGAVTLLMGNMTLTRSPGAQFLMNSNAQLIGTGQGGTVIAGGTTIPAVQQAYGTITNINLAHFSVIGSGGVTAGVPGVQFGGPNSGMAAPNWPGSSTQTATIGYNPGGIWSGYIAQVAFYNHALTATQIANHYSVGTTGTNYEGLVTSDSPIAYFPLKETTGTTATDISAGHNGTYSGGVTLASVNGIPGDTSCGGVCKMPLFNGTSGMVTLPSFSWINSGAWTIEGWFQPNVPDGNWAGYWGISDGSNQLQMKQNAGNGGMQLYQSYFGSTSQPQVSLGAGVMYHIVVVHITTPVPGYLFYFNGTLIRIGSDVLNSFADDIASSGFDIGMQLKSEHGCICYNHLKDMNLAGVTYGLDTENASGYPFGVNSNTFVNGRYGGNTGIYTGNGAVNVFIKPDMESNGTAPFSLNDYSDYMINPYIEASGGPGVLGAGGQRIQVLLGNAGVAVTNNCAANGCEINGPDYSPIYAGVAYEMLFGTTQFPTPGTNAAINGGSAAGGGGLDVFQRGNSVQTYGRYGHAPFRVGQIGYTGGSSGKGRSTLNTLGPVPAPTATATGGTGTNRTYYAIGYDINGGIVMPSPGVTVSGPATLDASHYITITPPNVDGIWCWDVLKGDTAHVLTIDGTNHCGNLNAFPSVNDTGQATVAFAAPSRDTTGDLNVANGQLQVAGLPVATGIANGSTVLATTLIPSGTCQAVSAGSVNSSAAAGASAGNKVLWTPNVSLQSVSGYGVSTVGALSIDTYITSGYVNFNICNWTVSSITPGALTLNWMVIP